MSDTPIGSSTESEDLLRILDRAIDVRIDARLAAVADRVGAVLARQVIEILRCEDRSVVAGDQLLLTVPEAAKLLSLSRSTVYELMKRGDLPAVKIGGARRIPADSLDAFRSSLKNGPHGGRPSQGRAPAA